MRLEAWRSGTIQRWRGLALPLLAAVGLLVAAPARAGLDEARAAFARKDYAVAVQEYRPLAEAGNAEAQSRMGIMSFFGQGMPQDDAAAVRWLRRAAAQGYAPAETSLAALLMVGRGAPRDSAEASRLLHSAAAKGNSDAMFSLGHCAQDGGCDQPVAPVEAAGWFRQAADRDNPQAENALGVLLWKGAEGVPADHGQAVGLFRQAAAHGLGAAEYNLGKAYEAGAGVPQNLGEAYYWLSLAAAQAPSGATWPAERDAVARRLSPDELQAVQRRTADFRPVAVPPSAADGGH